MSWRLDVIGTVLAVCLLAPWPAFAEVSPVPPAGEVAPAAGSGAQTLPEPRRAVADVLRTRRFEFCHNPEYALTPSEKRWCELGAGKNVAACPTLAEACRRDALARQLDDEPLTFKLPQLGLPWRLLLWVVLGLAVGFVLFALVRRFLDRQQKDELVTEAPATAEEDAAAALARQVETDVQRLLARARAEAAAGDYRAAMSSGYAALLRQLEGAGVVRVEADQTNGDYLGMVRKQRPALAARVAEVVEAVEVAQFGRVPVTREGFEGLWLRVTGLLAERIGSLLLLAVLAGGGACGQPRADWDHSPSGRAGVVGFLGKRGFTVRERLLSVAKLGAPAKSDEPTERETEQLVLLPGAQVRDEDWQGIERWLERGGKSLVIAGGRRELPGWIGMRVVSAGAAPVSQPIVPSDTDRKRWGDLRGVVPGTGRLDCQPGSETLLERGQAVYAAQRWRGDDEAGSRVVVIADDLLLRNASLLVADNAVLLDHLLRDGGLANELAGDLTGLVASNPVESVQRGRLGPALLQLGAVLLLFFVCRGARFGRATEPQRLERRELAEHVRALGLHYARARADRFALGTLGAYVGERLRERFGLNVDRSLSGLAEAVATRTGRPVGPIMRLLVEARDAGKGVAGDPDANDFETAVELVKLLEETGGTRGHRHVQDHV